MFINEGGFDRLVRIIAGIAILGFVPQTPWAWIGLLPLATGAAGFCPIYWLFGWSTNRATTASHRRRQAR